MQHGLCNFYFFDLSIWIHIHVFIEMAWIIYENNTNLFFLIALFPDYQFCHRLANRQKMKNQKTRKKKFMNIWKERKKLRKTINVFLNLTRVKPATTQLKRYWQPLKSYDDMCLNPDILPNGRHMGTLVSAEGRFQLPLGAEMFLSKTLFMQIYEWDTFCF